MAQSQVIEGEIHAEGAPPSGEGVTEAFSRDAVRQLSRDEPGWLRERRLEAWSVYEREPFPSTSLEEWRYTDIVRRVDIDSLELVAPRGERPDRDALPGPMREAMDADHEAAGRVAQIDADVVFSELDGELAEKGVILTDLRTAAREHPELLRRYLATDAVPAGAGKFAALNGALWSGGAFLHVPRGVHVDLPVRATRWLSGAGTAIFPRTLIVAEPGSHVNYVEEYLSDDLEAQSLACDAVEIHAAESAQVQYVALQRFGRGVRHVSTQRTLAGKDSILDTLIVNLGASLSRIDLNARLLGPGARSEMLGIYFGDGEQHFDHNTRQDHMAANTWSDLLYKGALRESSRSVFRGVIRVHDGAQQTDAYQTNRNLLLSPDARADSLPNLEIEADDVRCSHGATVGQLEEDALFYLRSRGIPEDEAKRLIVVGFLGDVVNRLPLGGVVEKVTRAIEAKVARG